MQVQHWPDRAPDPAKPYCLVNPDGTIADWFTSHDEAVAAMKKTSAARRMYSESYLTPITTEFAEGDGVWIEALEAKTYHTPQYGEVVVSNDKLNNFVDNFKKNVRGIDITTDFEHGTDPAKGKKASGTVKDARVDGNKLLLNIGFTDTAKQEIAAGEWKYFSSDWLDKYVHEDGTEHVDVLLGGGLTNRPVAKGLQALPINFSELYLVVEKEFSDISGKSRNDLPDSEFLYIEPGGKKDSEGKTTPRSLRHLPVPDEAHLNNAISRLSQKGTGSVAGESWLTDSLRSRLLSKARSMKNRKQGGEMNELLKRLAEQLGIQFSETDDETEVQEKVFTELTARNAKVTELEAEVAPLRELKKQTETAISFAEQFPEQARQMEQDRLFRIQATNKEFTSNLAGMRFSESTGKKDDEGKDVIVVTSRGLSARALEAIGEVNRKFAEGTVTQQDFADAITGIFDNGIVSYGEVGTSVGNGPDPVVDTAPAGGNVREIRTAFSERVKAIQTEVEGRSFTEALAIAQKENPKMFEAYMESGAK